MGTARRGSVKVGAVALAALIGSLSPGINPLASAAAQSDGERPPWAPGPPTSSAPSDSGAPDDEYIKRVECITSASTDGKKPKDELIKNGPWGQRHLRISDVHRYVRGKSAHGKVGVNEKNGKPLKVAVIDTGVTPHPFFQGRVKPGGDYVKSDDGNGMKDCDGHGTQVAGIIAGNPNDPDIGFVGVAPDAEIIAIRQTSQNYSAKTEEEIKQEREQKKRERERKKKEAEAKRKQEELARKQEELQKENEKLREENKDDDNGGGDTVGGSGGDATGPSQDDGKDGSEGDRGLNNPEGAGNQKTLAQAIMRAVDKHKADVINISVDACRPFAEGARTGDEKKLQAAIRHAADEDSVVVAAAGNAAGDDGGDCQQNSVLDPESGKMQDPNKPRTIVTPPWFSVDGTMLSVGAIDSSGSVAEFSMRGPWVSVAAPGTDIVSLDPADGSNQLVNVTFVGEQQQPLQGTSFAAPYVSGLAVLVKQMHPDLSAREIIQRIEKTAQHPGAIDGRDQFIGNGVIDPMSALTATLPEDLGIEPAKNLALPSDMPPSAKPDHAPMIVALAGSAGALAALGITLFTVHTLRRNRRDGDSAAGS